MRVGIITLYYKSMNYGGNLQAYALCNYLRKNYIYAEQIQFQKSNSSTTGKINSLLREGKTVLAKRIILNLISKTQKSYENAMRARKEAFIPFREKMTPHTAGVYDPQSINECIDAYDTFITGSDQVWNFKWYNSAYFLDFVSSDKKKVAYAASFSMNSLDQEQSKIVQNSLKDFKAISVREKSAVDLIDDLTDQQVELVLDPTLLLEREDWEEVCNERLINEDYIFSYFLGENPISKKIAEQFAKQKRLKLVTIPYAAGAFNLSDKNFGDIQIGGASPQDFLSLIRHASYVFTDSFHAVVFSFVFKRQFFVFNRDKKGSMNTRIKSITELFDIKERFCERDKESIKYVNGLEDIDYSASFDKFEKYRKTSYEFLKTALTF